MSDAADPLLESVLRFWDDAGVDVTAVRALAGAAAKAGPAPLAPTAPAPRPTRLSARGPVEEARAAAAAAESLDALADTIAAFDGCALKASAKRCVFGDGVQGAPLLVIGEAPGRDEDLEGKPFIGRAGQLLDRMLATIGVSRTKNAFITNIVFWRPPGNRQPDAGEIAICRPFVERIITLSQPKAILLVGGVAGQAMLQKTDGVMRLRGKRFQYGQDGLTLPLNAMVMLHPAYLLRRPQEKGLAWADLLALEALLDEVGAPRDPAP